jgi:hypothetical protein
MRVRPEISEVVTVIAFSQQLSRRTESLLGWLPNTGIECAGTLNAIRGLKMLRYYYINKEWIVSPIDCGLPCDKARSAPAIVFSRLAQRSLTLRPARSPSRQATLYTESSDSFVASAAASIATGWSEPVPGRELHPLKSSAFHGALYRQLSVGFFHTWEVVPDYAPGEDNQTCNPGNKHDH